LSKLERWSLGVVFYIEIPAAEVDIWAAGGEAQDEDDQATKRCWS
jgi:hypothetical protein